MKLILTCISCILIMLFSFISQTWIVSKAFVLTVEWSLLSFVVITIILTGGVFTLSKILSALTTLPAMMMVSNERQMKLIKQFLLWIGWGIALFNSYVTLHQLDFDTTKVCIMGIVLILINVWIPWGINARFKPLSDGVQEGEKMAIDVIGISDKIIKLIDDGETTFQEAMEDLHAMKIGGYINDLQKKFIIGLINKKVKK